MNINKVRFPRRDFFVNVNENAKFEKQSVKKKVITMKTEFVDILTKWSLSLIDFKVNGKIQNL